MSHRLFQYAIVLQPKFEDDKEVEEGKIIKEISTIFAASDREVTIIAAREIPDEYMDQLDRVEVAVRPF
jgi:hypothetical protein